MVLREEGRPLWRLALSFPKSEERLGKFAGRKGFSFPTSIKCGSHSYPVDLSYPHLISKALLFKKTIAFGSAVW